jgi:hypothetical protein
MNGRFGKCVLHPHASGICDYRTAACSAYAITRETPPQRDTFELSRPKYVA